MKKLLILILVSIVSSITYAYDYPKSDGYHVDFNKDGSTRLAGGTTTERNIAARTWESTPEYEKTKSWFNRSMSSGSASLDNGARINSKVPVSLKNTVSKRSVMRGLLANARAGGRLASRNPWVFIAFTLVGDKLIDQASEMVFEWDSEKGDYMTTADYVGQATSNGVIYGEIGFSTLQITTGLLTYEGKIISSCQSYASKVSEQYNSDYVYSHKYNNGTMSFDCVYVSQDKPQKSVYIIISENTKRPITQDEFDNIMIPIADNAPSEFVNASRPSQNGALDSFNPVGHELSKGATYTTDIYTDPNDGKAKSTTVTVNADGTSVNYSHTMRPDLDGDTELAPIPKPNTDNDTEPETQPPTSASVPLQCDDEKYPDSLGCVDTTEEIEQASMTIPQETVPLDFQVKNYITSSTGTCPQGSQFTLNFFSTHTYEFSFEPVCSFAEMIKYALWVCSWLIAYYIVIGRPE